jgi:uncharacterized glyoxalase superfamily protein PhnB
MAGAADHRFGIEIDADQVATRCTRAVAADATVVRELCDTDYGSREFSVSDLEGNRWSFGTYRGHPR